MKEISVYEGEYEYLYETDLNFRKFVEDCEGKSIGTILMENGFHEFHKKFHEN